MKTLIKCGKLITTVDNEILNNGYIVIEDKKIIAVETNPISTDDYTSVLDFSNYTVMPGIIDCHDHLGIDLGDEVAQSKESLGYTAIKGVCTAKNVLKAGITTLRDVGEQGFLDTCWKRAIEEELILGPRILISGQFICRTGGHGWFFGQPEADGVDEIRKAVRRQIKAGVDLIKVMITGGMSTPGSDPLVAEYTKEEIATVIEEAHRANKKVAAHAHGGEGITWGIEAGIDSIEHGIFLTEEQIQMMVKKGTFLVATTGLAKALMNDPSMPEFYRNKIKKTIEKSVQTLKLARKHGVKIAMGGDTHHAHPEEELITLIEAGYTHIEAIKAATINGAELCGIDDMTGSIEVGKVADIIAIDGDPLKDIRNLKNVKHVIKEGQLIHF